MIGLLKGKVELLFRPFVIIDVNGVGYKVLVSENVYKKLNTKDAIKIYTYTYVREDALDLFGFLEFEDLTLFENLITVSGIGPKTALNIFSFGERKDIIEAIVKGDVGFFTSVPRLGTKNAQKIIIELKNKAGGGELDLSDSSNHSRNEVTSALKTFGFSAGEINEAMRNIDVHGKKTEEQIKEALKYLGK